MKERDGRVDGKLFEVKVDKVVGNCKKIVILEYGLIFSFVC